MLGVKSKYVVRMDEIKIRAKLVKIFRSLNILESYLRDSLESYPLPLQRSLVFPKRAGDTNEMRLAVVPLMENLLSLQGPPASSLKLFLARRIYLLVVPKLGWERMEGRAKSTYVS